MDMKISYVDLKAIRDQLDREGWDRATLDLFGEEIVLAEHVTTEFAKMKVRLSRAGLSEDRIEQLMVDLAKLVLEPVLLLDRGHKQLWSDFLPHENTSTKFVLPSREGRAEYGTFAAVSWDPKHVTSLRPDLTEFQAKRFLEIRQLEIASAMYYAGLEAIKRLLTVDRPGGKP